MDYKARFYSVGLGRFLQPDSIIPNPANPQSWNRYSYVENRPILFNDPFGHDSVCGYSYSDPECAEVHPAPTPTVPLGGGGNGGCNGVPDCGLNNDDDTPVIYPYEPLVDLRQNEPGSNYSSETSTVIGPLPPQPPVVRNPFESLLFWLNSYEWIKLIEEGALWVDNYGRPFYRHAKGVVPGGFRLEFGLGVLTTFVGDLNNPEFTWGQTIVRSLVVGGEDGLIEVLSTRGATFVAGGAGLGTMGTGPGAAIAAGVAFVATSMLINEVGNGVANGLFPGYFP